MDATRVVERFFSELWNRRALERADEIIAVVESREELLARAAG